MQTVFIDALEQHLSIGNIDEAIAITRKQLSTIPADGEERQTPAWLEAWREEAPTSSLKIRVACGIAEVLARLGENEELQTWLKPWVDSDPPRVNFGSEVPPRQRLQAVEFLYGDRRFDEAADLSGEILRQYEREGNAWAAGEAAFYLARSQMRLHNTTEVYRSCERALEYLTATERVDPRAMRWRAGQVLLVGGFAGCQAGHKTALPTLLSARSLLADGGDSLSKAYGEHAIGSVYRSMQDASDSERPDGFSKALERFNEALRIYRGLDHPLQVARVLADIGRTHFFAGEWNESGIHLTSALAHGHGIRVKKAKDRQQAETHVFLSWLKLEGLPANLEDATTHAVAAVDLAGGSKLIAIEALLALGSAHLASSQLREALGCFNDALRRAIEVKLAKPTAHAHLCMTNYFLHSSIANYQEALKQWRLAEQARQGVSSRYLEAKASAVSARITDRGAWIVTREDLFKRDPKGNKFKRLRQDLERWIVESLEAEKGISDRQRSRILGVSASAYLEKKKKKR